VFQKTNTFSAKHQYQQNISQTFLEKILLHGKNSFVEKSEIFVGYVSEK